MRGNQAGFTIIEMAMVLVIVGLLVGFGTSLVRPLSIRAKRMETTATVEAAGAAIVGYATANRGVLPTATGFPGVIQKRNDAWSRPIAYLYDADLADGNSATGDLCTRRTTHITVNQCPDAACSAPVSVSNVAYLLLSSGENVNNQTDGARAVGTDTVVNVYPTGVDSVDGFTTDLNRPEPYDDIVQWATLHELRSQVGCRGPHLSILNNELPPGRVANPYAATIYVEGGVPFSGGGYLWCVETPTGAAPAGLTVQDHTGSTAVGFTANGSALSESAAAWTGANHLLLGGTPTSAGSYLLTVWVRDNNNAAFDPACSDGGNRDNCDRRSYVLTISP